ncbi:hypothetical protein B0H34DRAFT_697553 [Crassisporium funariophilum]|nr:hypothetical protein B0H34DRAFT_697553 [Crassisporium funariophilum]
MIIKVAPEGHGAATGQPVDFVLLKDKYKSCSSETSSDISSVSGTVLSHNGEHNEGTPFISGQRNFRKPEQIENPSNSLQPSQQSSSSELKSFNKGKQVAVKRWTCNSVTTLRNWWIISWMVITFLLIVIGGIGIYVIVQRLGSANSVPYTMLSPTTDSSSIYGEPDEHPFHCKYTESIYRGAQFAVAKPVTTIFDHQFSVRGIATGIITLASAPDASATEIVYDILIRGDKVDLDKITIVNTEQVGSRAYFNITTPSSLDSRPDVVTVADIPSVCMHYDITIYVPRPLKCLRLDLNTPAQIRFSPEAHINLDTLDLNLNRAHPNNLIFAHESVKATNLTLSIGFGTVKGSVSIMARTTISNSAGVSEINVIPAATASSLTSNTDPAILETYTDTGIMKIHYLRNPAYRKRRIISTHFSSNHETFTALDYIDSTFKGLLHVDDPSQFFTSVNLLSLQDQPDYPRNDDELRWTHFANTNNSREGADRMTVRSGSGQLLLPLT